MITMIVNHEIVMKEYEKESQEIINMLRNSNSKYKNTDVEKMKWAYSFSYFKKKSESNSEYYERLYHMPFDERLEEEIKKVRVNIALMAGYFNISDRVEGVSDSVKEAVKYITIQKMVNEQTQINDNDVIDSIPLPKEEMIPTSLEDQLKNAIEAEDYIEAARIRDEIKKDKDINI